MNQLIADIHRGKATALWSFHVEPIFRPPGTYKREGSLANLSVTQDWHAGASRAITNFGPFQ